MSGIKDIVLCNSLATSRRIQLDGIHERRKYLLIVNINNNI